MKDVVVALDRLEVTVSDTSVLTQPDLVANRSKFRVKLINDIKTELVSVKSGFKTIIDRSSSI